METAYIQERKTDDGKVHYRVQVRLKGFPTTTATFDRKTDAKLWAQQTEAAMREGRHFKTSESKKHTVGDLVIFKDYCFVIHMYADTSIFEKFLKGQRRASESVGEAKKLRPIERNAIFFCYCLKPIF